MSINFTMFEVFTVVKMSIVFLSSRVSMYNSPGNNYGRPPTTTTCQEREWTSCRRWHLFHSVLWPVRGEEQANGASCMCSISYKSPGQQISSSDAANVLVRQASYTDYTAWDSASYGGQWTRDCLWDVAPCSLMETERWFRCASCLYHPGALKTEAAGTSERPSVSIWPHGATSQKTVTFKLPGVASRSYICKANRAKDTWLPHSSFPWRASCRERIKLN
jgi:hypothetical protein